MVDAAAIARSVEASVLTAARRLRPDVEAVLRGALVAERSERGRFVLSQLVENAQIAATDGVPLCQDTGTVWVWVELGEQELLPAGLAAAVDAAVAGAYLDRKSVV